ncbi:hypothetical protein E2I00_001718 [Balaenoptera physalus]|uniref:Uncharacterized protein n=1 Tax=Balaenoptera physalus TaxID=9770 RepID=A0A6A1QCJ1_BALPH|nr:hypothetical protein E2I00_001718 [Balaenoptera physalus]
MGKASKAQTPVRKERQATDTPTGAKQKCRSKCVFTRKVSNCCYSMSADTLSCMKQDDPLRDDKIKTKFLGANFPTVGLDGSPKLRATSLPCSDLFQFRGKPSEVRQAIGRTLAQEDILGIFGVQMCLQDMVSMTDCGFKRLTQDNKSWLNSANMVKTHLLDYESRIPWETRFGEEKEDFDKRQLWVCHGVEFKNYRINRGYQQPFLVTFTRSNVLTINELSALTGVYYMPETINVVAYVEVWSASGTENYSKTFTDQLADMGAKPSVYNECRTAGVHIDESLFPAANPSEHLPSLMKKKRKCMQPKDFIPKTPENDKRLQKKFEKMAKELQQQKTTLGNDAPVLLFESNGSLVYSPPVRICSGHHSAAGKRLQAMQAKREDLFPTSSQMVEKSDDNTVNSLCEASLNLSHDTLCSEDFFAGVLHLSFDDLCGSSGCGTQQRKLGRFLDESKSAACASSAVLKTSSVRPPASPGSLASVGAGSGGVRREEGPVSYVICNKRAPQGPFMSPELLSHGKKGVGELQATPGGETEEEPPAGPALLHCTRSLSRRERTSLLERADFSCIGRNPRSADGTYSTVKAGFRLQKPANYGADLGLSSVTSKETPAAEGTPGDCPRAEAQRRGDARPGGSDSPHTLDGLTPQKGRRGDFTPLKGSNKEMKGWIDIKSTQKEDTPSKMVNSPEGEALSDYKLNCAGDCDVEKSAEAREELPRGRSGSVKRGPTRHDVLDGSWEGFKDLIRPHEESRKREKGQKWPFLKHRDLFQKELSISPSRGGAGENLERALLGRAVGLESQLIRVGLLRRRKLAAERRCDSEAPETRGLMVV